MPLKRRQCRILLADDESQVRSFVKAFLVAYHFEVVEANDGSEALDVLYAADGAFDLLITDIQMPRCDGIALARISGRTWPQLPVLFVSGYAASPTTLDCAEVPRWTFLAKPFLPRALLKKVEELLGEASQTAGANA